jgi:guanylate kinase
VEELKRRLHSRGTESEDSLNARVNKASYELSFSHSFNHIIVNSNLERACAEAEEIVSAFIG